MRILKTKIALSAQSKVQPISKNPYDLTIKQEESSPSSRDTRDKSKESATIQRRGRKRTTDQTDKCKSTKTVVKNYGKAIASFAASSLALPYLVPLADKEGININEFINYITTAKESIEGIDTFRALLLPKNTDTDLDVSYKRTFQGIAQVFINYFSVNWIFSGRMADKKTHLMCRFKMLRRIQNPELFTYLK